MDVVLVKNADRMMTSASLLDDGIELSFADGIRGLIPYADVPEVRERGGISGLELPSPYVMILHTAGGQRVEVTWDFTRPYCDASYRLTVEAMAGVGRRTLGQRVRRLREKAGMTQVDLARSADIGRVTLVRLENGDQIPKFKTMDAIAHALGTRITDLLVEPEFPVLRDPHGPPSVGVHREDASD